MMSPPNSLVPRTYTSRKPAKETLSKFTGLCQSTKITLEKLSLCLQNLSEARASEWVDTKLNTRPQTDQEIRLFVLLPLLFQVCYDANFSHDFIERMIYMEVSCTTLNSEGV